MKTLQLFAILMLGVLTFTACDKKNGGASTNSTSPFLLDRETQISQNGDSTVIDYRYNMDLLVGIKSELDSVVITYEGSKIIRLEGVSEGVESYSIYEYDEASGDKPSKITSYIIENGEEQVLAINRFSYENALPVNIELVDDETDSVFASVQLMYSGENVIKSKSFLLQVDGTNFLSAETAFTYDDKLSPYALLPRFGQFGSTSKNNVLTENTKFYNADGSLSSEESISYTYQYNNDDFASKVTNNNTDEIILFEFLKKSRQ